MKLSARIQEIKSLATTDIKLRAPIHRGGKLSKSALATPDPTQLASLRCSGKLFKSGSSIFLPSPSFLPSFDRQHGSLVFILPLLNGQSIKKL